MSRRSKEITDSRRGHNHVHDHHGLLDFLLKLADDGDLVCMNAEDSTTTGDLRFE